MDNEKYVYNNISLNLRPKSELRNYRIEQSDLKKQKFHTENNSNIYNKLTDHSTNIKNNIGNSFNENNKFKKQNYIKVNNNLNKKQKQKIKTKGNKSLKNKNSNVGNSIQNNQNNFIKIKSSNFNLVKGKLNLSPQTNNKILYIKKNNNSKFNNNLITINRNESNTKAKLRPRHYNNIINNKSGLYKNLTGNSSKIKVTPHLINIDLSKNGEKISKVGKITKEEKEKDNKEIKKEEKEKDEEKKGEEKEKDKEKEEEIKEKDNIKDNIIYLNKKKNTKILSNKSEKKLIKLNHDIRKNNINHSSNTKSIKSININLKNIFVEKQKKIKISKNKINNITSINNNINKENNKINIQKKEPYKNFAFCEHPNKEFRETMEDFYDFKDLSFNYFSCFYFSIFDGHNGTQVALYLKENFSKVLLNELKVILFANNYKSNIENVISAVKNSFEKIDKNIINNKNIKDDIGSTGTIILLYRDPYDNSKIILISANIGDSKGYLINKQSIKKITKEHKCKDTNEVERIKKKGGLVFQGRVFGTLMLTRSFGDKEMKQYGVISSPYCFSTLIHENDLYIIIGSDGVWDVFSNDNEIYELSKEKMSSKEFAEKIVKMSIDRGTTDNVSCLVIKLNLDD